MTSPDYEGYTQALDAVRDEALADYWSHLLNINAHQVSVGRTYLWVSAALVGVYATAFSTYHTTIIQSYALVVLSGASFLLAALAFGVCLYAIPARAGYEAITKSGWGEFSGFAYELLKKGTPNLYAAFLTEHIACIDRARAHGFVTNAKRAKLLRATSWLLIVSFGLALLCGLVGVVLYLPSVIQ